MKRAGLNLSKSVVTWLTRAVLGWQLLVMKVEAGSGCEGLVAEAPILAPSTTRRLTWLNWRTCKQFIKHECYHSQLLYNRDMYGWWVSRDGENMKNWGGVVSVDYECTCLNNTCADTNYGCNCDMSDRTWREEGAFLKDKFMLLVKQLRFGDALYYSDKGYHTLGKLKGFGLIKNLHIKRCIVTV